MKKVNVPHNKLFGFRQHFPSLQVKFVSYGIWASWDDHISNLVVKARNKDAKMTDKDAGSLTRNIRYIWGLPENAEPEPTPYTTSGQQQVSKSMNPCPQLSGNDWRRLAD
jgi:hypothetical protein